MDGVRTGWKKGLTFTKSICKQLLDGQRCLISNAILYPGPHLEAEVEKHRFNKQSKQNLLTKQMRVCHDLYYQGRKIMCIIPGSMVHNTETVCGLSLVLMQRTSRAKLKTKTSKVKQTLHCRWAHVLRQKHKVREDIY
jgi:hypothetical protein